MQSPIKCTRVVRDAQYNQMWVVVYLPSFKDKKGSTVVHDYCEILQAVDQDKALVLVVFQIQEHSFDYFLWES